MTKEKRGPVSDPRLAAEGWFQGQIERNAGFRDQALNHNLSRNVRVVALLGSIGLMRRAGTPLGGGVECIGAKPQNFSSPRNMTHMGIDLAPGSMQAAHFLPGRIRVGDRLIWQFVRDPATRGRVEYLFAEVEHLPVAFNQADTAAEAKGRAGGLCAALAKACNVMITAPDTGTRRADMPLGLLKNAFEEWTAGAVSALRYAAARKLEKGTLPPLEGDPFDGYTRESADARGPAAPAAVRNRDDAVRILEYYVVDQQKRSASWAVSDCQWALEQVQSGFQP